MINLELKLSAKELKKKLNLKDGLPPTPEEIRRAFEGEGIEMSMINGLEEELEALKKKKKGEVIYMSQGGGSGASGGQDLSGYVPYTGATADLDLDTHAITNSSGANVLGSLQTTSTIKIGPTGSGNYIEIGQGSPNNVEIFRKDGILLNLGMNLLTDDRTAAFPDKSGTVAMTSDIPTALSGTYTPTITAETNLDATTTITEAQYMRVGSTVTVSGRFTANATLTATATSFEIDLPVASNIGAIEDVAGTGVCGTIYGLVVAILGSVANNTALIRWVSSDINAASYSYNFTYQVI